MLKKLGVLGGMGPLATVTFMQKIIARTPAHSDQEHIPMLVSSVPQIPDRTACILNKGPDPFPILKQGFEELQSAGASCIVIPCNTAHFWYARLQAISHVHTISIIDSVVSEAKYRQYQRVGILATTATMMTNMYQGRLAEKGIDGLETTEQEQQQVMAGIYAVKAGNVKEGEQLMAPVFEAMLARGADAVIFGCTEIPIALASQVESQPLKCLDSLEILADECIAWATTDEHDLVA
ncbi:aspartate/glutamate racemase family protein [Photobacterium sanguinicancri]|uniref:aspartate/glutamate racemase family protein n=1 Tax=Photobacterium sanguinicancri TaxID=875932 RepID=UPI0026E49687|nr:amino acid racemase [Photobacterium sanguinicancri]MDO6497097.1 amino acid racemase [Photobacterium sanguinicancri]